MLLANTPKPPKTKAKITSQSKPAAWMNDPAEIKKFQNYAGLTPDGVYGSKSELAFSKIGQGYTNQLEAEIPKTSTMGIKPSESLLSTGADKLTDSGSYYSGPTQKHFTKAGQLLAGIAGAGKIGLSTVGKNADNIVPYASNIINSFRKPPAPPRPIKNSPVTLSGVDYSADRAETERQTRAGDISADRALDGNTSQAVRSANLATKLGSFSRINQAENNANNQINNQQTQINAQIGAGNNALDNQYNQQLVEQRIAQQTSQSENLANASDKFIGMRNQGAMRDLDLQKAAWIKDIYKNSGVLDNAENNVKKSLKGTGLSAFKMGGTLKVSRMKKMYK